MAETRLLEVGERWGGQYAVALCSWERAWGQLATMFDYPPDIRRLIYTTNAVEGYNRQLPDAQSSETAGDGRRGSWPQRLLPWSVLIWSPPRPRSNQWGH